MCEMYLGNLTNDIQSSTQKNLFSYYDKNRLSKNNIKRLIRKLELLIKEGGD